MSGKESAMLVLFWISISVCKQHQETFLLASKTDNVAIFSL